MESQRKNHIIHETFGANMRKRRKRLGYTLADLAGITSLDRTHLNLIELARRNTSLKTAQKIADALDTTVAGMLE